MPLPLLAPAILAFASPAMPPQIAILPTQKALDLLKEGKVGAALDQLDLAIARDRKDPQPLWIKAQVYRELARQAKGWSAAWYRECAEETTEVLLGLPELEQNAAGNAMSLLQNLRDDERPTPPTPSEGAVKAFNAGEAAFEKQAWEEARAHYGQALKESPTFAMAALYIGDSYFAEQRMEEAVRWFRRAAELNPADPRAWRYMADAQTKSGHLKEAEATMIAAIEVFPANRASWRPLTKLREAQGRPMARLAFQPGVQVGWDRDGKQTIGVSEAPADSQAQAIWMVLAGAILDNITVHANASGGDGGPALRTRFQQERFFWELALKSYSEACQKAKVEPKDRILLQFLTFQKDGQLDAAIFLLRYREAFRPDYDSWRKAHPGAVEAFLNRYNIRP
jgi:tetratricopeptide (TPR) repeat protein